MTARAAGVLLLCGIEILRYGFSIFSLCGIALKLFSRYEPNELFMDTGDENERLFSMHRLLLLYTGRFIIGVNHLQALFDREWGFLERVIERLLWAVIQAATIVDYSSC